MKTNANSILLATLLKKARRGTFTGLITRKVGEERGSKGAKTTYGDDTVHVVLITGFSYEGLVQRSLEALPTVANADIVAEAESQHIRDKNGQPVTLADVATARAELEQSFRDTLAGTNESTMDHVYDPLVVDGETVVGGRVYKCAGSQGHVPCHCRTCSGDNRAPKPGTIYLQGLKVFEEVLTPAPNGPVPKAQSAAKTLAKNLLRKRLPVRRYVSFRLEPGTEFILRAGGTVEVEVTDRGFVVTDDIVQILAA
jgi:hypothetical protein